MPNKLELLAPAGSMEALRAALANGADAVYLGASAFGARASAGFDAQALESALRLAHLYRKKIYVTVNILVKEGELSDVRSTLSLLNHLGADAVLVQDLGVLKMCREEFPELPLHASTQMALHNAAGVQLLKELGAQRAVMARECDLNAIAAAARTGLEIEAFCHGAMCVSVSGQCLFSSMIGGRSGNRGRCAQPCRLPYSYGGQQGAWLSPRDLCARDELAAMAQAGVYSFKIEGRLKRPEYVAVVTRAYRKALDGVEEGRFTPADAGEREALTQIFSRGGFTDGYPGKARDAAIIDPTRVTPAGLPLGRVERTYTKGGALLCDVRLLRSLHNGDGLEIGDQQLRYSGPEGDAGHVAALRLRENVKVGSLVRRTEDESQLNAARESYTDRALEAALPIPFDGELMAYPGEAAALTVTDGESVVSVSGEGCQAAQNKALDGEYARRGLEKTGGTPFRLNKLTVHSAGAFLPASALNALRRQALEQLAEKRISSQPRPSMPPAHFAAPVRPTASPRLIVRTSRAQLIPGLLASGAQEVLLSPDDCTREGLEALLPALPAHTRLCLPAQCSQETLLMLRELTQAHGVPVCVSSPGQLSLFPKAMAGEGVPVMNSEAIRMLSHLGCASVTLSRELSADDLPALPRDAAELILPVYGRTRLMVLNHCPARTQLGLERGRASCGLCAQGKGAAGQALTDRMGAQYPLMPQRLPEGCLISLYAPAPLHVSGRLSGLSGLSYLLNFTDEGEEACLALVRHYACLLSGKTPPPVSARPEWGRFVQGVQ